MTKSCSLLLAIAAGCGSTATAPGPDMSMMQGQCAHAVSCTDQSVLQLNLLRNVATGVISSQMSAAGFESAIDATGGGASPTQSYVYARFTEQGLQKVDLHDEAALASQEWDIAFRRYVVRLNSGVSGPSCVTAARTAAGTTFDGLTTVPANLAFRTEEYFTATCDFVADGSGLSGSPGVALQSFWEYPGCVKMTNNVFVVKRADGRHVKLQVTSYYSPAVQAQCDSTGMVPMGGTGSANYKIKWALLDQ